MPSHVIVRQNPKTGTFHLFSYFGQFFESFYKLKDLAAFFDRHDYRYVPGTFGEWRLPS
jgi:hypothetical protein